MAVLDNLFKFPVFVQKISVYKLNIEIKVLETVECFYVYSLFPEGYSGYPEGTSLLFIT